MVGLPCSGKTTLAKGLARDLPALRLNTDQWHLHLFGQDAEHPEHDDRHGRIEAQLWAVAADTLALGVNVILDFGFWAAEEREHFRQEAARLGAASELHFLDVSEAELLQRLRARNAQRLTDSFVIAPESMKPWIASFQKPTAAELERRPAPS